MAFDASSGAMFMFGGIAAIAAGGGVSLLNDTWAFVGGNWVQVPTATRPPARQFHSMVFDWTRRRLVMFGGASWNGSSFITLDDTWEFDGVDWVQVATTGPRPADRSDFGMVFDPFTSRTLLFGGVQIQGSAGAELADTWAWDGLTWTRLTPAASPSPRYGCRMTNASSGELLLFGGVFARSGLNDTWRFDGQTWTQLAPATVPPVAIEGHMAYDRARDRVVLWSGNGAATHEWDGQDWRVRSSTGAPSVRTGASFSYDPISGRVLAFGGCAPPPSFARLSDTWSYGPTNPAAAVFFGTPCTGPFGPQLSVTESGLAWLGETAQPLVLGAPPGTTVLFGIGPSNTVFNGAPLPQDLASFGMAGCLLLIGMDTLVLVPAPTGIATLNLPVPNNAALLGGSAFVQAAVRSPGANPRGLVTTEALELVVGSK